MEKVYTVRMQEIIHYIAYELEAPDAALHLLGCKILQIIISTHLLLWGGVHYLTLSGLVEPIKWRFSGLWFFHQTSSNGVFFVANGV
ncbi:MAG: hypothetical protein HFI61_14010 [Lachnospiraceae bacterium]|nr:hypothetical protein [Lachnospiraceae bacterium]